MNWDCVHVPIKLEIENREKHRESFPFHTNRWLTIDCPTGVFYGIQNKIKNEGHIYVTYADRGIGKIYVDPSTAKEDAELIGLDYCQKHWEILYFRIMNGVPYENFKID